MDKILIVDFGGQYTQLIARKIRELNVCSEIFPYNSLPKPDKDVKGIILSGSPYSVKEEHAPIINVLDYINNRPVLGICYGAQMIVLQESGTVEKSHIREYGRANLFKTINNSPLLKEVDNSQIWMSHSDTILDMPSGFEIIGKTEDIPVAAYQNIEKQLYGLQFHPEVVHTSYGKKILENFLNICKCDQDWTPAHYVTSTINDLKNTLGDSKVVMGLSGGVDSTVAATLLSRAIGNKLYCIFVDNGLLRKNEFSEVIKTYQQLDLNVIPVDAKEDFYTSLKGISDPELKRKAIGKTFIDVFEREAKKITDVEWLGQGTIYPDVIESASTTKGPAVTIKSHHNVGGLPEKVNLKIIEPLKMLFKDEVRKIAKELAIPTSMYGRHPFPGPGLGIRILGEISREKIEILQEADHIYIEELKNNKLYDKIWQAATILLPVKSVGVMGDERTYEYSVVLRAVQSTDGMTADWYPIPHDILAKISNKIINLVKGINRVVYDISSKPPATIEWE